MDRKRTVFVTGASRGIGKAIAEAFGREGCNVAVNCEKNGDMLGETARAIETAGGAALPLVCDMSGYAAASDAYKRIEARFGGVDVLVNNAGISHVGLFNLMEPEEWRRVIDVNVLSVLNATRLALPGMLSRREGAVINISSIWGQAGASCEAVYSLTKGAVNAFTKALAKECAPNGVRVNAIACGVMDTGMNGFLTPGELADLINGIPMSRLGTPEEAAELALYLASPRSSYITGQIITLDGGMI